MASSSATPTATVERGLTILEIDVNERTLRGAIKSRPISSHDFVELPERACVPFVHCEFSDLSLKIGACESDEERIFFLIPRKVDAESKRINQ